MYYYFIYIKYNIDYRELAHLIMEIGKFKICRANFPTASPTFKLMGGFLVCF